MVNSSSFFIIVLLRKVRMDKDTFYFNIKNNYLRIFSIIIINLQLRKWFKRIKVTVAVTLYVF
ncbi:hypothetical protein DW121_09575 [Bacteroides sp. AM10-21B]|nr:hypothetical protein DXC20_08710 [Bacteroides sp. OM08-17BH]RHJ51211.1 hypothetical protein DW121_09575 [Bacteroides sp. AM10-21B]HBO05642.1 hypothetical protein [Bacteroides sp.]